MSQANIQLSVELPLVLWEEMQQQAKTEQEQETTLLVRAVEQFLHHNTSKTKVQNGKQQSHSLVPHKNERQTSALGKYAYVSGTVAEFLATKQAEIDHEGRQR